MKQSREKNTGVRRGIYILPNIITTAALFCGFYSIIYSINGNYLRAAWAILIAGIFDLLDGRVARLTRTRSDFGSEYDSLCDLASFGLAPAILAYTWTLNYFDKFGWGAAFLFFACGALRLARYNVQIADVEKKYFQGLPVPVAAYAIASYVIFHIQWRGDVEVASYLLLFLIVGLGLLMVSKVRYRSLKSFNLKRKESFLVLVGMAVLLFIVASAPEEMIFLLTLCFVGSGLVEEVFYRTKKRKLRRAGLLAPNNENTKQDEPLRVIDGKA